MWKKQKGDHFLYTFYIFVKVPKIGRHEIILNHLVHQNIAI